MNNIYVMLALIIRKCCLKLKKKLFAKFSTTLVKKEILQIFIYKTLYLHKELKPDCFCHKTSRAETPGRRRWKTTATGHYSQFFIQKCKSGVPFIKILTITNISIKQHSLIGHSFKNDKWMIKKTFREF